MRALSLWQPWASLVAHELKKVETRGWEMRYRGPLAIHATAKPEPAVIRYLQMPRTFGHVGVILDALAEIGVRNWLDLPFGQVLCTVDVVDCKSTDLAAAELDEREIAFGNRYPREDAGESGIGNEREIGGFSMKAQIKVQPTIIIEVEADKHTDLFRAIAGVQEVFGQKACGKCGGKNLQFRTRKKGRYEFYEAICLNCKARLSFGVHTGEAGTLFPHRVSESDGGGKEVLPDNGWVRWDPDRQQEV